MPREETRCDWCDAQAPIWLPRGREWKYFKSSAIESLEAVPRNMTWRSR